MRKVKIDKHHTNELKQNYSYGHNKNNQSTTFQNIENSGEQQQHFKDLIVKVDENYPAVYSLQPVLSYDNSSSSRSLLDSSKTVTTKTDQQSKANSEVNVSKIRSRGVLEDFGGKDNTSNSSMADFIDDPSSPIKTKSKRNNNTNDDACLDDNDDDDDESDTSHYNTNTSLHLKIDSLERRVNEKIAKRLPIKLVKPKTAVDVLEKINQKSLLGGSNENYDDEDIFYDDLTNFDKRSNSNNPVEINDQVKIIKKSEEISGNKNNNNNVEEEANKTSTNYFYYLNSLISESSDNGLLFVLEKRDNEHFLAYPIFSTQTDILNRNICDELLAKQTNNKTITQISQPLSFKSKESSKKSTALDLDYLLSDEAYLSSLENSTVTNNTYNNNNNNNKKPISINSSIIFTTIITSNNSPTSTTTATTTTTEQTTTTSTNVFKPANNNQLLFTTTTMISYEETTKSPSMKKKSNNMFNNKLFLNKSGKIRHRKRLEGDGKNANKSRLTHQNNNNNFYYYYDATEPNHQHLNYMVFNESSSSFITTSTTTVSTTDPVVSNKCDMKSILPTPLHVLFIGVFHCTWMNNIRSTSSENSDHYYITKSYKGSSVTVCQTADELATNRCYRHFSLKYAYYGTGHVIYKDYMFYNQDGTSDLVSHSIENTDTRKINSPDDAQCCDLSRNLYNIKHSGFFDFEVDENGLWMIYKQKNTNVTITESNDDDNEQIKNSNQIDTFVIAKIDESKFKELKIERKWFVKISKQANIANMFITCGQLYALKGMSNPALVYKLCDLYNDFECSNNYTTTMNNDSMFNLTISSRQLTSLSYNVDKKLLYMVDGGSFVYYKIKVSHD